MNDDDYKDYSIWSDFYNHETAFASNAVVEEMIKDLKQELKEREIEDK